MPERLGPQIEVYPERILKVVKLTRDAYERHEGIFAEHTERTAPEKDFVQIAKDFGQKADLPDFALDTIFFLSSIVYSEDTQKQFERITDVDLFKEHWWIFHPEAVVAQGHVGTYWEVMDYFKPRGYNSKAATRWHHNAQVLMQNHQGSVRQMFQDNDNDALKILAELTGPKNIKKSEWPGFQGYGSKLSRLFLQWVGQYELADLQNIEEFGIPVDFQVARITIQTEGIVLPGSTHKSLVIDKYLVPIFAKLCRENNLKPKEVSEALWLLGSRGCNQNRHAICPVREFCKFKMSRKPLDTDGKLDPDKKLWIAKPIHSPSEIQKVA